MIHILNEKVYLSYKIKSHTKVIMLQKYLSLCKNLKH